MAGFGAFDARGRQVLELAKDEAVGLRHNWIGTEHLLLGIARQREDVSGRLLHELGVEAAALREAIRAIVPEGSEVPRRVTLTPRVQRTMGIAEGFALGRGTGKASSEHLLLAVLEDGEGVAVHVLRDRGVDVSDLRSRLLASLDGSA